MFKTVKIAFVSLILLASCSTDDNGNDTTDAFDRGAMLTHWADNIIIPSFQSFNGFAVNLEEKTTAFTEAPNITSLAALRTAFNESYIQFQTVSLFETGPAENLNYRLRLNTYPASVSEIQQKISVNEYNFELPSSFDEQGFPALDYLINGLAETDAEIITFYTTHADAATYKDYLNSLSQSIQTLTAQVLADWQNTYRNSFVSNTSSSSTGSVDRFTNDFVFYYEKFLRSGKIGIPSGIFTGNPVPGNVEAFYSESLSKTLYLKSLETVQNFFNGRHFNSTQTGPSYSLYLETLNAAKNGEDLETLIDNQFNAIRNQAAVLNANFVEQIQTDNNVMLAAFDELQKNVVLQKVDLMQALSISVDYVDSDGD